MANFFQEFLDKFPLEDRSQILDSIGYGSIYELEELNSEFESLKTLHCDQKVFMIS